jgi:hypothetical protein
MDDSAVLIYWIVILALAIIEIAAIWVIFTKADKPGWAAIIPIYNLIVWLDIIGKPAWWVILFFIPFINIYVSLVLYFDLAKVFGKGSGFGCGLILLPFIFFPILAFGDAQYQRPMSSSGF